MRRRLRLGAVFLCIICIGYMIVLKSEQWHYFIERRKHNYEYVIRPITTDFPPSSITKHAGATKHAYLPLLENLKETVNMCSDNVVRFVKSIRKHSLVNAELLQHAHACRRYNVSEIPMCSTDVNALQGHSLPDMTITSMQAVRRSQALNFVHQGGWIYPTSCLPRHSIALIIPFRNREKHLPVLLRHLLPIVRKRNDVHMRIFVIDQVDNDTFNRGKARNVGFLEALKLFPFTCFVFHDVDLVPEDDRIPYDCAQTPMHLSVAISKYKYKLKYDWLFGGVQMVTKEQYLDVNGFPNTFWEWGGEDDNFHERMFRRKKYKLVRPPEDIARYTNIPHEHKRKNFKDWNIVGPYVDFAKNKFDVDGVNNTQYEVVEIIEHEYYTRIKVDMKRNESAFYEEFEKFRKHPKKWRLP